MGPGLQKLVQHYQTVVVCCSMCKVVSGVNAWGGGYLQDPCTESYRNRFPRTIALNLIISSVRKQKKNYKFKRKHTDVIECRKFPAIDYGRMYRKYSNITSSKAKCRN